MSAVAEVLRSPEETIVSSFLKNAPVGLAVCQSPGTILSANSGFRELLGLASTEIHCSLSDLMQEPDASRSRKLVS